MSGKHLSRFALSTACLWPLASPVFAQPGTAFFQRRVSDRQANLNPDLAANSNFGSAIASLGDINADGVPDIVAGGSGSATEGKLWVLRMRADGTVDSSVRIGKNEGGFTGPIEWNDQFGDSIAVLDLDGDGVQDLAVGAPEDDGGGSQRGAIWILFMHQDATVKSHTRIGDYPGEFAGQLADGDRFGEAVTSIGDLDDDGVPDLAVGAYLHNDAGQDDGAVWILFMQTDGSIKSSQKISGTEGGFTGELLEFAHFGSGIAAIDDLDGDGNAELAVGAEGDRDGGIWSGAIWLLYLNDDGTVKRHRKISESHGGFGGKLGGGLFGADIAEVGDQDANGLVDLLVGTPGLGAAWLVMLHPNGTVRSEAELVIKGDGFGFGVGSAGDLDGDGRSELAVGAPRESEDRDQTGAVWVLKTDDAHRLTGEQKISDSEGTFTGRIRTGDRFGTAVAGLGDLNGDGIADYAAGAPHDRDGGEDRGKLRVIFPDSNGWVLANQRISSLEGEFDGPLADGDHFATAVCSLGDLSQDGTLEIAVGVPRDDGGSSDEGAVWILSIGADGRANAAHKIGEGVGGFGGALLQGDRFGGALAHIPDLDGDGVSELAVGAAGDDGGGNGRGAVWILFLNADATVRAQQKISAITGGGPPLGNGDQFGASITSLGDSDGDGLPEIAVGAHFADTGGENKGALWILSLNSDGAAGSFQQIGDATGGFNGELDDNDNFGASLANLSDLDGDGVNDLGVGAPLDDDGGTARGAVWVLFMNADATVKGHVKLSSTSGGFSGDLDNADNFGRSIALFERRNDGQTVVIGVGADRDNDGGPLRGAIWTVHLRAEPGCPADLDDDGDLDAEDFFAYLDAFASGDLDICDIDQDADCDAEDFFGYLDRFAAGC